MTAPANPYYHPESLGLTPVSSVDLGEVYEFDIFVVWTDGRTLYWADDSGCSCPIPFEDITTVADLQTGSAAECLRAFDAWLNEPRLLANRSASEASSLRAAVEGWRP